jgi:phosphoribosylaminoimidazolecarboxamide formyltransferase / IMP cyclohydrolase
MSNLKIKRAIIAVYDKTGIVEFARALVDEFGIEIISTGGTARHLKDAGIPVTMVEQVTGFPEMLDGRVKTLHPMIHAGILADRDKPEHMKTLEKHGIKPVDMVVVNLYPFEDTIADPNCTFEQAIEMIDIGGPCMLRAAAKNHKHVVVICQTEQYEQVLEEMVEARGQVSDRTLMLLAQRVYRHTSSYDLEVASYLADQAADSGLASCSSDAADRDKGFFVVEPFDPSYHSGSLMLDWRVPLRYGENPAQAASAYLVTNQSRDPVSLFVLSDHEDPEVLPPLSGGALSFNNFVDGDAALSLVKELTRAKLKKHAVAFIKHMNACGCAIGDDPVDTYRRAYLGDPIAAAGGVLCMNFPVTLEVANTVMNSFGSWGKAAGASFFKLDVWIAPRFDEDAVKLITTPTEKRKWGKECRLLAVGAMDALPDPNELDYKKITGGMLVQTRDLLGLNEEQWDVRTQRKPTDAEMADLRFAWLVCKHTKSNAITLCRDGALLGNGAGQMSRVKSCDLAIQLSRENGHGDKLRGAVAAGDAFFPVPDGPQKLIDAGITAMIHPGGGNRDADTIAVADQANIAMILTGTRHFKH